MAGERVGRRKHDPSKCDRYRNRRRLAWRCDLSRMAAALAGWAGWAMIACSSPPNPMPAASLESPPPAYRAMLEESLAIWDGIVGFRRTGIDIALCRRPPDADATTVGRCRGFTRLEIYPDDMSRTDFELRFQTTVLHELTHAHMRCSDRDHVANDPTDLMSPLMTDVNLGAVPSRAEIEFMWLLNHKIVRVKP
jgi:hypothetical protein